MNHLCRTLFCLTLTLGGCVSSIEEDVQIAPAPSEDADYAKALAKATKQRTVFKNFETRYMVTATYLSPEFRAAFTKRLEKIYRKNELSLGEAVQKAGFFVSIQAPDDDRTDLTNPHHWTLLFAAQGAQGLKPVLVRKLTDKERWRAFFDSVNEWTSEYLIVFDAPSVDAQSPALVQKTSVGLTFANADAQVSLTW